MLLLTGLGHLRAAGVALDNADRAAPEGGDTALLAQLTRLELVSPPGDDAGAAHPRRRGDGLTDAYLLAGWPRPP